MVPRVEEPAPVPPSGFLAELRQRVEDRLPPGVREIRWRVGPAALRGTVLLVVVAALLIGVVTWRAWPDPSAAASASVGELVPARSTPAPDLDGPTSAEPVGSGTGAPSADPVASGASGVVLVHVVGRVGRPGVVSLPAGARVVDAVTAAGGPASDADLTRVNLARPVVDGEQILVPAPGEPVDPVVPPSTSGAPAAAGGPAEGAALDLNAASAADLDALPGIGEVLAERIVQWRSENGRFSSVDDLGEVRGIGPTVLDRVRGLVRV